MGARKVKPKLYAVLCLKCGEFIQGSETWASSKDAAWDFGSRRAAEIHDLFGHLMDDTIYKTAVMRFVPAKGGTRV